MKVLQINSLVNRGAPGRIAEEIGKLLISSGNQSTIAYAREKGISRSELIKVSNYADMGIHVLYSRLFDKHGFGSYESTKLFIKRIEKINPDIIHLHNIHGYYLNVEVLFKYLKSANKPVVWTLHDCWPFTGHCSYYDYVNCSKWKTGCHHCPIIHSYPKSWFVDNSIKNYAKKREIFTGVDNLVIVTPSQWLINQLKESFLSEYPTELIYNGIDLNIFKPIDEYKEITFIKELDGKSLILGVAHEWDRRKGLHDFIKLSQMINEKERIVLIGLSNSQLMKIPKNIIGLKRTQNIKQLVALYNRADAFVNPTYVDNFPTTNIEALACGTPVITYDTGGSPEAVDGTTGIILKKGDVDALLPSIRSLTAKNRNDLTKACRQRAVNLYNAETRFQEYLKLYYKILK